MTIKYDSIIIGAGLSALFAADLLQKQGKSVAVIAKGFGGVYSSSGCVDLLGYIGSDASNDIARLPESHPYTIVGQESVFAAINQFKELTTEVDLPYNGRVSENKYFPTAVGSLRPTCLYPENVDKNIFTASDIVVVGIDECIDFHAKLFAETLQKSLVDATITYEYTQLGYDGARQLNSYDVANYLERKDVADILLAQLAKFNVSGKLLVLPAVLGLDKHEDLHARIEKECNCRVMEIPTLPPSVAGMRLYNALASHLKASGVKMLLGHEVKQASYDGDRVKSVFIEMVNGKPKEYAADDFILATGGVLSGGIIVYPEGNKEPIFDLTVEGDAPLLSDAFSHDGQNLSKLGVSVSNDMKNTYSNLYVIGAMLKGYDPFVEKSGGGVALATAYKACQSILGGQQ